MLPLSLALLIVSQPPVRPIPPKGVVVSAADRAEITGGLAELRTAIDTLPNSAAPLLPDVEVLHKAVRWALDYDEFLDPRDIPSAKRLLALGLQRARELKDGKPSWPTATGLVVRGYRSKIDGSIQPYGLVVPASYTPTTPHKFRLDVWWRGRQEKAAEVGFLADRITRLGEFAPKDAFVVHPFGRYCNANKFAGEVDTFEVLDHVQANYPIDKQRLVARGFSMGGAACWQFATHFPTHWSAAAPGAGFAETPEFLRMSKEQIEATPWWERRLWRWYNATDYAYNLLNLPTVAYSGERDGQKQAADVMARELARHNVELTHVIGAKAGHQYTPAAKVEIDRTINALTEVGQNSHLAAGFTTYTLRYNLAGDIRVDGLERHWQPATVKYQFVSNGPITTTNVSALSLMRSPGQVPYFANPNPVQIDGTQFPRPPARSDRSSVQHFRKVEGRWTQVPNSQPDGLAKIHGLQGPIDDAFLDRFLMVRPTGKPLHEQTGKWVQTELDHALRMWRSQYRGDAPAVDDNSVTDEQIANANLVLWGDPSSNKLLARILPKLPLRWSADAVEIGSAEHDGRTCVPVMIYPNPLNPKRYVVLNSGFTWREKHALNNADQTPKLPDYAILDTSTPPDTRSPGQVVRAGFFGERWEPLPDDGR